MKFYLVIIVGLFTQGCNSSSSDKTGYININDVTSNINITKKHNKYLKSIEEVFIKKINLEKDKIKIEKQKLLEEKKPTQQNLKKAFKLDAVIDSVEQLYSKAYADSSHKYELIVENKINELVYQFGKSKH